MGVVVPGEAGGRLRSEGSAREGRLLRGGEPSTNKLTSPSSAFTTRCVVAQPHVPMQAQANCRVEVSKHPDTILDNATIKKMIGSKCDGVIGQLTEVGRVWCCGKWEVAQVGLSSTRWGGWRAGEARELVCPTLAAHLPHLTAHIFAIAGLGLGAV